MTISHPHDHGNAAVSMTDPAMASSLRELIDRYEHFRALSKVATDKVDELYQSPGEPEKTFIVLGEVDPGERGILANRSIFRWQEQIDTHYADAEESLERRHSRHMCNRAFYANRKAEISTAREAAKALLAERIAAHEAWKAHFGIPSALAESDRLCEIECELDRSIRSWPLASLEDVRLVASHILREHGPGDLDNDIEQFLKSIAGEPE